jgi:hypothetical protein
MPAGGIRIGLGQTALTESAPGRAGRASLRAARRECFESAIGAGQVIGRLPGDPEAAQCGRAALRVPDPRGDLHRQVPQYAGHRRSIAVIRTIAGQPR